MSSHAFVYVVVNSIAWRIFSLQVIALSHLYLSLVLKVGPALSSLSPKLLCTDVVFLVWNKGNCVSHGVFGMSVFGESPRVDVVKCNLN